jgi:hypothetical protein
MNTNTTSICNYEVVAYDLKIEISCDQVLDVINKIVHLVNQHKIKFAASPLGPISFL